MKKGYPDLIVFANNKIRFVVYSH